MTTGPEVIEKINADKSHPLFVCIFCKHYITDIGFDLDLHLYEKHKLKLIKLLIGKGSFNFIIGYAIDQGKKIGEVLKYAIKETREKLGWSLS